MTTDPTPSSLQSMDDVLEQRASEGHARLSAEGKVLLDDRVIDKARARRSVYLAALGDLWRAGEALFVIVLIAGFGALIHQLIKLFLQ